MRGALWAVILVKFTPSLEEQLLARGAQIGRDRVIAGVHFPTDVAAGQKLGVAIARQIMATSAFRRDLRRAKAEFLQPLNGAHMRTTARDSQGAAPAASLL
jgi:membrane-associated phospholipid phosphatase